MAFIKCSGGGGSKIEISDNIKNLINNVFSGYYVTKSSNANTNTFSYTTHMYSGPITSSHISTYGLVKLLDTGVDVTSPKQYTLNDDITKYSAFISQGRVGGSSSTTTNRSFLYPTIYALMTIPVSNTWAKEYYPLNAGKTDNASSNVTKYIFTSNTTIKAFCTGTAINNHGIVMYGVN